MSKPGLGGRGTSRTIGGICERETKLDGELRELAGNQVDMVIIQCRAGKHCAMRMKSCSSDWRGAVVLEEARVRLVAGKVGTINVVGLNFVSVGAPGYWREVSH